PPSPTPLVGKITVAGSTTMQPLVGKLSEIFIQQHPLVQMEVAAGGSVVGIRAVHEGTADIGMASRALKDEEAQGINVYPIALDALAIVVNSENPVTGLTLEQLQDIYFGKITNWKELGGNDLEIVPVQREISSGTRGAFDEIALEKQEATAPALVTVITAGDVAATVAKNPGAIGYVGFGNLEPHLKVLEIDGILPSPETIKAGQYRLYRPLSLLTGPNSQPLAQHFIDFVLSETGTKYIEEFGWIAVKK
ncbi:MAG: phosphate ABC transporter substrate-binding protein, partial [Anaerolineales bacterium]|nr:phosphate ABC transporter substrate-binding protein [Anaerolineales bacterium]MDW8447158.1 phosphate ABC transporter substrate-binding protein [Anaerolineales bacterium]